MMNLECKNILLIIVWAIMIKVFRLIDNNGKLLDMEFGVACDHWFRKLHCLTYLFGNSDV